MAQFEPRKQHKTLKLFRVLEKWAFQSTYISYTSSLRENNSMGVFWYDADTNCPQRSCDSFGLFERKFSRRWSSIEFQRLEDLKPLHEKLLCYDLLADIEPCNHYHNRKKQHDLPPKTLDAFYIKTELLVLQTCK